MDGETVVSSRKVAVWLFAYLAILVGLLFASLLALSIMIYCRGIGSYDDSTFLVISSGIASGRQPYVDYFDAKPPGLYYVFAAVIALFGRAWWIPRTFLLVTDLLFIGLFLIFALRHLPRHAAIWGGLVFCLSLIVGMGYQPQTRLYAAMLGALGLVVVYDSGYRSRTRIAGFGFLCGVATLFNQAGMLYLFAFVLAYLVAISAQRRRVRHTVADKGTTVLAYMIPLAGTGLYFHAIGALDELVTAVVIQPASFVNSILNLDATRLVVQGAQFPALTLTLLGLFLTVLREGKQWRTLLMTRLSLITSTPSHTLNNSDDPTPLKERALLEHPNILVWLMGLLGMVTFLVRYHPHHLLQAVFPLAFLCADIWAHLSPKSQWTRFAALPFAQLLVVGVLLLGILWEGPLRMMRQNRIAFDITQGQELYTELSRCLAPTDPVLAVGMTSPRLYYLSQHMPLWRYVYIDETNASLVSWTDALKLLEQKLPRAVLLEGIAGAGPNPPGPYLPEFRPVLARSYVPIPLQHALHPVHGTTTELYVLRTLPCDLPPQENPLFP